MPASVFDRETQLNGLWIRVLDLEEFERTDWIENRQEKGNIVKQDSLLRTWQYELETPDSKTRFDQIEPPDLLNYSTDSDFKISFRPDVHYWSAFGLGVKIWGKVF
jgi:hypothetical protein